ncbi:glycosyltransferase [Arachnia propionica]|uniref:glycosyltransferase n=1 Tax=Arachnia propionica TaxID=1750 RepID=UPI001BA79ACD|nr:glycosyltransferase family 2 protein [Arachnia propionica]QUC13990.1 glycosyltransferase [Arachnia propionica]
MLEQPMRSSDNPEWAGAVWVGELDLSDLASAPSDSRLELAGGSDYHRARFLVREDQALRGFVTVGIEEGRVRGDELRRAVDELPVAVPEPEPPRPPISVVICTRDRGRLLRDAVDSVLASDYPDFEVVVVDNAGSTSETRDLALRHPDPRVRYVHEPLAGVSRGRNRGLRVAVNEHIAFIDDDVVVDRHWLTGIARGFARDPHVGLVCGLVPSGEIRTRTQAWFDQRVTWADAREPRVYSLSSPPPELPLFPFQVGAYGTGANTALTRTAFESVGGFDVTLGGGQPTKGGEDIDLYLRMLAAGYSISVEPSAITWHRHRSDLPALKAQARGYGTGMGAWFTKILFTPSLLRLALPKVPGAVARMRTIARGGSSDPEGTDAEFGFPRGYTASLGSLEMRSALTGPLRYAQACLGRWRHRREGWAGMSR